MSYVLPPVWLIILIIGLPQLCESIYSPALPEIAAHFLASDSMVELTLTIYLFSFGIGCLFFGKISDLLGRKPCIVLGLIIFTIGTILCFASSSIEMLIISRFIQAFGGSIGSVLGQAVCRDAFKGVDLSRIYATVGSALSLFPAIGPVFGGILSSYSGWRSIFLALIVAAIILNFLVVLYLPETHHKKSTVSFFSVFLKIIKDKKVLKLGLFVGGCNGISFGYYAEAPFYFIEGLGIAPTLYGASFLLISFSNLLGGLYNRNQQGKKTQDMLIFQSLIGICIVFTCFSLIPWLNMPTEIILVSSIFCQMMVLFLIPIVTGNSLSLALKDYQDSIGTASSIFGCYYYTITASITLGLAYFHNGSLYVMPTYFLSVAVIMMFFGFMKR